MKMIFQDVIFITVISRYPECSGVQYLDVIVDAS